MYKFADTETLIMISRLSLINVVLDRLLFYYDFKLVMIDSNSNL